MRTKVAIDTCAVRGVIDEELCAASWLELGQHRERFHFALFDTALTELFSQLQDGQISWADWIMNRPFIAQVIDDRMPVFLRIDDPSWRSRVTTHEREDERHWATNIYRALMTVRVFDEIYELSLTDRRGRPMGLARGSARDILDRGAAFHAEVIEEGVSRVRNRGIRAGQRDLAKGMLATSPNWGGGARAWMQMASSDIALAARKKSTYDPRAPNRRGDHVDRKLLIALSLPAYIISEDGKLARSAVNNGVENAHRILTIDEFVTRANGLEALT